jgi:hypothetical protein
VTLALVSRVGSAWADLPAVTLGRVTSGHAGGAYTRAMTAELDGREVYAKSLTVRPNGMRYANLEADVLAEAIFTRLGIRCPRARFVRMSDRSTCRELGDPLLIMESVDERFARGALAEGRWPGPRAADVDQFLTMALVDLIIGNSDRHRLNFFTCTPHRGGALRPIPIDNNLGFCTALTLTDRSRVLNFVASYDGTGAAAPDDLSGRIDNLMQLSPANEAALREPSLRARVLELTGIVVTALDDAWWHAQVDALPDEMIPGSIVDGEAARRHLLAARRAELKAVFAWRREHLKDALVRWLATPVPREPVR